MQDAYVFLTYSFAYGHYLQSIIVENLVSKITCERNVINQTISTLVYQEPQTWRMLLARCQGLIDIIILGIYSWLMHKCFAYFNTIMSQ